MSQRCSDSMIKVSRPPRHGKTVPKEIAKAALIPQRVHTCGGGLRNFIDICWPQVQADRHHSRDEGGRQAEGTQWRLPGGIAAVARKDCGSQHFRSCRCWVS